MDTALDARGKQTGARTREDSQIVSAEVLLLQAVVESEVGEQDDPPTDDNNRRNQSQSQSLERNTVSDKRDNSRDKTSDGTDVVEVGENGLRRRTAKGQVCKETKETRHGNAVDGKAVLGALSEDARGLAFDGKRIERSRRRIEIGVTGTPSSNEENSVDDG